MSRLAIVLPGMSYGHGWPALRVTSLALAQGGSTVHELTYPVLAEPRGDGPFWTPAREERFFRDVESEVAVVLDEHAPAAVTLVGKSLGTSAVAHVLRQLDLPPATDVIWLTPLWREELVFAEACRSRFPSLYVVGEADPAHDPERHQQVVDAAGGNTLSLAGAGHTLEVEGDVLATVDGLSQIARRVLARTTS